MASGDATVVLVLVIDATGVVTEATVRQGEQPFAQAAIDAAKGWRFAPATRDESPVPARILATVSFTAPAPAPTPTPSLPSAAPAARVPPAPRPDAEQAPPEVSVRGEREQAGTTHIPRSETRLVPGAFGDPFRVIEALPGMAPWLSGLPYYYVRGSPPESVGYFVDGIRIPILFHVGAGPSTIAPALVDSVDLFAGGYPAAYGRYAGAVVAGETRPPDGSSPARGEFDVRVFDASAFAETPLDGGQATAMAAARYSYTGLLTSLIVPDYTVDYWDYQARVSHRVADRDDLVLFVFGAHDELTYKHAPTFRVEYHRADLRYEHPLPGGHLRVAATYSYDDTLTALQTPTGAGTAAALKGPGGRLRAETEERVAPQALVRAGGDVGVTRFSQDAYGDVVRAPHTDVEGGVHGDVVWRPDARVEIVPGLRVDGYFVRGQTVWAPQPRLAARVRLTPTVSFISAIGAAHQEATEEVFVPAKLPYPIDHTDGAQLSGAVEARLPSGVRARATAFYSRLLASGGAGRERAEGIELFVRRDFTRRLGGFASYTLSRSETTASAGVPVRSPWDRTHLLSLVLGYDLGEGWRVGARVFAESGRPYGASCTPPDCPPGQAGQVVTGDLPAFFRIDTRLEKKWTFPNGRWLTGTIECFNVLDRAEPIGAVLTRAGVGVVSQSPIILPSVGLEGGL